MTDESDEQIDWATAGGIPISQLIPNSENEDKSRNATGLAKRHAGSLRPNTPNVQRPSLAEMSAAAVTTTDGALKGRKSRKERRRQRNQQHQ